MTTRQKLGLGALLLSLAVASPIQAQLLSPGPLSRAHASLEGDDHCSDCHSSGRQVSTGQCLGCHSQLASRIQAGQGLHGREYRGQACGGCHIEHLGRGSPQIRWPGGRDNFNHSLTGWPLRGDHASQECNDCHTRRGTFLGLRAACSSCHEDSHDGRFGNNCQSCHNERSWSAVQLDSFDHSQARFPLRGRHQRVDCARCHHEPPRYQGIAFSSCSSCHADPHAGQHGNACSDCHTEEGWDNLDRVRTNHPGLSLGGGHRRVTCVRCHNRGIDTAPSRGRRCVGCHQAVHEAPFGNNCASCHGAIRWLRLPERVGRRAHSRTPFPLNGAHTSVDCGDCHNSDLPRQERFRELEFDECSSCHEDPHEAAFTSFGADNDCGTCHTEAAFAPSQFTAALHGRTEYPLEGRHEVVACNGCHQVERPRLTFEVGDQQCADCHENPHGDQFAREMRQGGCASCHNSTGWDRPNIDHSTWPLTGAHSQVGCDSCHTPTDEDRSSGQGASYRGVPRECVGCHNDVHGGQFRLTEPERDCTFCHGDRSFNIREFDHENLAGYPLQGEHADLGCEGCHQVTELENGDELTNYRLGFRACSDCHANPHSRPNRPRRGRESASREPAHPNTAPLGAHNRIPIFQSLLWELDSTGGLGPLASLNEVQP